MSSINCISVEKLAHVAGVPHGPALVDVRTSGEFAADGRFIPGATRRSHESVASWASDFAGGHVVVVCHKGQKLSEGVAAWLRHAGAASALVFAGGHAAWLEAGLPTVAWAKLPSRDAVDESHDWVSHKPRKPGARS